MGAAAEKKTHSLHETDESCLCRHGFHQWVDKDEMRLDEVTSTMRKVQKCAHCGKEKLKG